MTRAPRALAWWRCVQVPALCALGLIARPAAAQLLEDPQTVIVPPEPPITTARSIFARDAEVPVADRALPAFSAQGFTLGNFDVYPGLAIGGVFDSNVFADNDRKRSDFSIAARPEITVRTSGGPYSVEAFGRGEFRRYATYTSEDTEEGDGGVTGTVAIGALSTLTAGVTYGSYIEPRSADDSPEDAAKPLEYNEFTGNVGGTIEGARTRVIFRADVDSLRFRNTPSTEGGTLFTKDRDRDRYEGSIRVERALTPAVSIYGAATVNAIDYRLRAEGFLDRNSTGFGAYIGSSFQITNLMRGDARIGYIRQNFDQAGLRPITGLGAKAKLVYFPNQLWTFTAQAESSVADSGVPGTTGYLHRGGSIRADNELRRYLIASLEGGYFHDSYRGEPRRDRLPFAEASLTYLSQHHWNARLGYRYTARDTNDTTEVRDFDDHRLSATLTFQY